VPVSSCRAAQGGWNPHQEPFQTEKAAKHDKMIKHGQFTEIAIRQCFCQGVFTQPRPNSDIDRARRTWAEADFSPYNVLV